MAELEATAPGAPPPPRGAVAFGPFRFDAGDGALYRDGAEVPLPPRALGVLALLLERAGRLVPKQLLLDTVWSDTFVSETSLTEAVSVLRQALGDNPQSPTYIQTVHRRGYRFIAGAVPAATGTLLPGEPSGAGWLPGVPSGAGTWLRRRTGLALAIAAAAVAAALGGWWQPWRRPAPAAGTEAPRRLLIGIPAGAALDAGVAPALALSPSGRQLIYVAREGGVQRLYLRALDRFEAAPVAGSEGAAAPFFSPGGEWVGFFAQGKLKKVALAEGGGPLVLCDSPYPYGASWSEDGSILFAPDFASGLRRAAATGGAPTVLTTPDRRAGEIGHRWPEALPGGRAALFTVWRRGGWKDASIDLLDLRTGRRRELLRGGSCARWSPTGHLVFARAGGSQGLAAVPFDLGRLALLGPPVAILDGPRTDPAQGAGQFALSRDGTLVYVPGGPQGTGRAVYRLAPGGDGRVLPLPPRPYRNLALSADGRRLALTVRELDRSELWVSDVDRGNLSRLTFDGDSIEPVWSPDGRWIAFAWARGGGRFELYRAAADGSRPPERLLAGGNSRFPTSFSPDGRLLAFTETAPGTGADLWVLPLGEAPRPFLRTAFDEERGRISPDGRWLAYQSNESGSVEVYVRPFPGPGGKWQISAGGGSLPAWSADGRRILYRRGTALMAVTLSDGGGEGGGLSAGPPQLEIDEPELDRFAVSAGGGVVVLRRAAAEPERLHVVLGFGRELARLAP